MPLSRQEQQQLEATERYTRLEDPDFVRKLQTRSGGSTSEGATVWVLLVVLVGALLLPVGIAAGLAVMGVLGFILLAAGTYGLSDYRPSEKGQAAGKMFRKQQEKH
ncbi:MAG: DUF3040 domain-containing protein [Actinomycetota bacterium]